MQDFALTASSSSGGEYEMPSAGNHAGRIIGLINGGTHESSGLNGQPAKRVVRYLFVLELSFEKRSDGTPFVVLFECSASLHAKAKLRKLVHEVLNRSLNDGDRFSATEFLGQPCAVVITHEVKAEKTFYKVTALGPPFKGMAVPEPTHPQIVWSVHSGQPFPAADHLPFHFGRSVSDWIAESDEAEAASRRLAVAIRPPDITSELADGDINY
jgi:hypothetical protein